MLRSRNECLVYRSVIAPGAVGLSPCTEVGSREAASPDLSLIPEGDLWQCFSPGKGKLPEAGTCFRSEADCELAREGNETPCKPQRQAFLFSAAASVAAFSSAADCKSVASRVDEASRCAAVASVPAKSSGNED